MVCKYIDILQNVKSCLQTTRFLELDLEANELIKEHFLCLSIIDFDLNLLN